MPTLSRKEKIISSVLGFLSACAYLLYVIFSSSNSTAAIGLLFIPVYGALGALVFCAAYYLAKKNLRTRLILCIVVFVFGGGYFYKQHTLAKAQSAGLSAEQYESIRKNYFGFDRQAILVALAANPHAPAELFEALVTEGPPVRRALAGNPAVPLRLLEDLSQAPLSYDLHSALAANPVINQKIIDRLLSVVAKDFSSATEYELYQTYVLGPLARHKNLNSEDFIKLTQWPQPEYFLVYGLIESGRASCEFLRDLSLKTYEVLRQNARSQLKEQGCSEQ